MSKLHWAMCGVILIGGCRTAAPSATTAQSVAPSHGVRALSAKTDGTPGRQTVEVNKPAAEIELTAAQVAEGGQTEAAAPPPVPSLSLVQSIALGLEQNPDLIALRETDNVSSAALGVAQTYPFNPFVQVQATPYQERDGLGPGTTYHYVLLMQTIQLAHQQQFREAGAASTLNSTRWNIHQAELLNVAQTQRLYFSALYLRGILELAQASDDNNQELLRTLEKQLDAGQATAADVAIVRVDARSTKQQVCLARSNYETAIRDFKRQLGVTPADPISIAGDLRKWSWTIPPAGLAQPPSGPDATLAAHSSERATEIAGRVAARPDVMAAHADIDAARAAMGLATASKTPDLQVGPYYQRTVDGTTFLGFRAQMDLPVINSGRPLEQQRVAEFNQRVMTWTQLRRRAELEAQAAWERYELAQTMLAEDASTGVPDLPKELASLEQQFLAGEVDIIRVVQARTSLIQNQRVRLDLLNEVAQSASNLTATAAIPLDELTLLQE